MKVTILLIGFPALSLSAWAGIEYLQAIPASLTLVSHPASRLVGLQALSTALTSRDDSEVKKFKHDQGAPIQFFKLANSASNPNTDTDFAVCGVLSGTTPGWKFLANWWRLICNHGSRSRLRTLVRHEVCRLAERLASLNLRRLHASCWSWEYGKAASKRLIHLGTYTPALSMFLVALAASQRGIATRIVGHHCSRSPTARYLYRK